MRILLISQYFWPEFFIINDLVKCLVNQGHSIEVLTGKPNYPEGAIFKGYTRAKVSKDYFADTVPVHRIPIFPRKSAGITQLFFNYCSFIINGLLHFPRFVKNKDFDVILFFAPSPITSVIPAILLKKRLKKHLAVWVQDLWPESVSATGFIKNSLLMKGLNKLVKFIYTASDSILVPSQGFKKHILPYAALEKIIYYPNSFLDMQKDKEDQIQPYLLNILQTYQCLVFAGNLGKAQSLETIIAAAEKIKHLSQCKVILLGKGRMSEWIKEEILKKKLDNLILHEPVSVTVIPTVFSFAYGLLVSLKDKEIFSYTIPSKIQAYLASGKPILASLNGEGASIIQAADAGFVSAAEDAEMLAKNIQKLYSMPLSEKERLGKNGRAYFLKHFEMEAQSQRLIEILKERIRVSA